MDSRRPLRGSDPKVRHVGFFTPAAPTPDRTRSGPPDTSFPHASNGSPSGNSLSPIMIPPPRHASDNLSSSLALQSSSRAVGVPVPASALRRPSADSVSVGGYNPHESLLATSSEMSPSSRIVDGEFSEDSDNWIRRSDSGKFASSFQSGGGLDVKAASVPKRDPGVSEKRGGTVLEVANEVLTSSKPLKEKTTKAERRALQESQRAAKAAARGAAAGAREQPGKPAKQPAQKKDGPPVTSSAASEKRGGDRLSEKERKKDVPPPRMQFDDKNRVQKAKRHAIVKQTEARSRVELFRHLPQYEHGTRLHDLESKFFQLDPVHPAVYKVGVQYLAGDIFEGNARCVAMLRAFQEAIKDYFTPPEKTIARDLAAKINSYVSFLIECRPLSISMGNAIRFLKARITKLPVTLAESDAKASICSDIDRFISEKILLADKVIVAYAITKIRDGDVVLTFGSSSIVEMVFLNAHELGKQFCVVLVDSRPKLEGQALLRRLVGKGLSCTYTHINAVSYIMHEVTRVFLGASSVLSNGTVFSKVGTACVSMVAHAFSVPVLICCESYKFHERVQLDSICSNELGDPDAISKVLGRMDINYLDDWANKENLQLLNLIYDATPPDYVSMIVTEYGMVPPTSVPVIVREYGREQLLL